MPEPVKECLYADGGVIRKNPSPEGGTWAWCLVSGDKLVAEDSGVVVPAEVGLPAITNNLTELLAVLKGLQALPDGWHGDVYTDSLITLRRVSHRHAKFNGIPEPMRREVHRQMERLGRYQVTLLGGHPTKNDLRNGKRPDGLPVSKWNVRCDETCGAQARLFLGNSS